MQLRPEVQIVREALDTLAGPEAAVAFFEALERAGGEPPRSRAQALELVHEHLASVLADRLGERAARLVDEIVARIEAAPDAPEADVVLDIDVDDLDEGKTAQMTAVAHPVSVLVASTSELFAQRLVAVLGEDRVYPFTVRDEAALRHATFSAAPLVLVVDTTAPPDIKPKELAAVLRGLPKQTTPVVWSQDTDFGRELRVRLEQQGIAALFLARAEGFEPLLDIVLSRRRQSSRPPVL